MCTEADAPTFAYLPPPMLKRKGTTAGVHRPNGEPSTRFRLVNRVKMVGGNGKWGTWAGPTEKVDVKPAREVVAHDEGRGRDLHSSLRQSPGG